MLRCACLPRAPAASMRRTQPVLCCGLGLGATELRRVRPQVRRAATSHRRHRAQRAQGPAQPAARRLGAGARPEPAEGSGLLLMRQWLATGSIPCDMAARQWLAARCRMRRRTARSPPEEAVFLSVCLFARGAPAPSAAQCRQSGFSPRTGGTCVWHATVGAGRCAAGIDCGSSGCGPYPSVKVEPCIMRGISGIAMSPFRVTAATQDHRAARRVLEKRRREAAVREIGRSSGAEANILVKAGLPFSMLAPGPPPLAGQKPPLRAALAWQATS
jgi:hypothetical protein